MTPIDDSAADALDLTLAIAALACVLALAAPACWLALLVRATKARRA